MGPGACLPAVPEPRVLVGGMGQDQVGDDLQAEGVGAGDQPVEIGQGPEDRIDVTIVGHVIAEVLHRRGVEGAQPDRVHTQGGDVVEVRRNAGEVADAVAPGVGIAARIDLIDDGTAPPVGG